tara:strand:+ start:114 stop:599 length:486 start_codon:yes stop_codon:yes gene_type:complete
MIEYVIESQGEEKVAVGIRGDDKTEIINHYWGFWNWKATSGEDLIWANEQVKPYLGYFWTSKAKLKNSLVEMSANMMIREGNLSIFKGEKGGIMPFAREYAEERMKEFRPMTFLVSKNKYDFYNLGQITAENLADYDAHKGQNLSQYQHSRNHPNNRNKNN